MKGPSPDHDSDLCNREVQSAEVPRVSSLCFTLLAKKLIPWGEEQMNPTPHGKTATQLKCKSKSTTNISL